MLKIVDSHGRQIHLGERLGGGGEGDVLAVVSNQSLVAKLYHPGRGNGKREKILAMSKFGKDEQLIKFAAWPIEPLFNTDRTFAGFLMGRISGFHEVHDLYSPKSRRTAFPTANWPFLIHTALNIAKAFATVHERGYVIGDVNHGNVLVSGNAMAMLIDCDSFQIQQNGTIYRCEVGTSTYTPPELQGKAFSGIDRTANHDNFGLAVLIFHLLFMGRHPFAGQFSGSEDMPIEKAIERYLFAYCHDSRLRGMAPPPNTLKLQDITPQLRSLFEKAFTSPGNVRPTSLSWVSALNELAGGLKKCGSDPSHDYFRSLNQCPWCEIERRSGAILFGVSYFDSTTYVGSFQFQMVWSQISAVTAPTQNAGIPKESSLGIQRPAKPMSFRRLGLIARQVIGATLILLAIPAAALTKNFLVMLIFGWIGYLIPRSDPGGHVANAQRRIRSAQLTIEGLEADWNKRAGTQKFDSKFRELVELKNSYEKLAAERVRRLKQLEDNRRSDQMYKHLDSFYIRDASIPGIGPGRVTMLESYGIETAADITFQAVDAVPGFGSATASKLVAWKSTLEKSFRFDSSVPVDSSKIQRIELDIMNEKKRIENRLMAGSSELISIKNEILAIRENLKRQLVRAHMELWDAQNEL